MTCETCGRNRVVSIRVQLGDGSHIELSEGQVPLTRVLELAAANRPR